MDRSYRHREILDQLDRLIQKQLDGDFLLEQSADLLAKAFPGDFLICASLDQETHALRRFHGGAGPPPFAGRVYINEYLEDDFNKFADLVRSPSGVGILDEVTGHHKESSVRYRELYRKKLGMEHELRGAVRSGKRLSGIVSLLRPAERNGYDAADARLLSRFVSDLEPALRQAWLRSLSRPEAPQSIGQIILDHSLKIEAANSAGERWRAELGSDWEPLVNALAALVRLQQSHPSETGSFSPSVRMTTKQGRWVTVHGSFLQGAGSPDRLALIIEGAGPSQLQTLLWDAYGLTQREQEVFRGALKGDDTRDIAAELGISPYTVQDFFKGIFEKTGVRSRRDLLAKFLPGLGGEFR